MANPTKVTYKLPVEYVAELGKPAQALNPADIKQVNLGLRPASGTPGVYPVQFVDVTFTADANGVSAEALDSFGMIAPGDYRVAGQTVMKSGAVSKWSEESAVFSITPPEPNPPTDFSVA